MTLRFFPLILGLGLLYLVGFASGCQDEPDPMTQVAPAADFTFVASATEDFTIEFTSTSTDADTYAWDFGDGESSTEKDPSYTYKDAGTYTVVLTVTNEVDNDSRSQQVTVQSPYKNSGFVVSSVVPASGSSTFYTDFYDTLPSGDIDLTQGQGAATQFYTSSFGQFFYGRPRTVGEFGVAKFAIDEKTGDLVEVDRINTLDAQFRILIVDDQLGFSSSFSTLIITVFNPTTMEKITEIDLSQNSPLPAAGENIRRGVNGLYYNEITGKLIIAIHLDRTDTTQFYDLEDASIEVIDVETLNREASSTFPQAMYIRMNGVDNAVVDEQGNLYLLAQGSYGLDGNAGPAAAPRSRPQILKVDAQTGKFDPNYAWNPVEAAGFGFNPIQVFTAMVGTGTSKAYGLGTAALPPERLIELLELFAQNMLDAAGFLELQNLVFESEVGRLMELDLVNQTATVVASAPLTAGYSYPYMYNYDGKIYHQVSSEAYNGYYVTDPTNNSTSPVFNLSAGGFATALIRLEE
ncbi:MAG: PKD domain-containing protein [Bacteroidota bacterium]